MGIAVMTYYYSECNVHMVVDKMVVRVISLNVPSEGEKGLNDFELIYYEKRSY